MFDVVEALALRARKILQIQKEAGEKIDRASITKLLELDAPTFSFTTKQPISPEQIEAATRLLWTIFITEQGPALFLKGKEGDRPAPWYVGERRQPGHFMQRYLSKLEEDNWPEHSRNELKESTARILEAMDDPLRTGTWDWRGLVVGDVQSGKTASYAGVVNRAADAGYRIIIVLAGMHKILRLQTQKRFDLDVLGYDTNPKNRQTNQPLRPIGVGTFTPLLVDSLTMADMNGDFSQKLADQANFSPDSKPCLFIVKKNAKVLENLNNWIARLPSLAKTAPVLVIDDEADQASVDTGDQPLLEDGTFKEEYDPKRVNGEIRKLLMKFERRVYLGYTATPFANIFIHDERSAKEYGPDLFPSTFISALTPPDDYFGPAAVFGTNDDADNVGLPLIRPLDQLGENWIPEKHDKTLKPRFNGQDVIPPSLEEAIDSFLLTCAARSARGQGTEHNSMLVHVSRFVDVHEEVHRQVERYLHTVRAMISNGDEETMQRLKGVWETDFLSTSSAVKPTKHGRNTIDVTWDQVRVRIADSSDKIKVITANGKTKMDIDYDPYKGIGLSVIAVGGDKLSRGLTLEGLSSSYFLRTSHQYDSLLQMGRWFGYRRGFADLCRLYTTPDMEDWFRYVATAQKELRAQFFEMEQRGGTPKEFGLKVAVHDVLKVTAKNKQRHAEERQSSYAGEGKIQTVMFNDRKMLNLNADVTDDFIRGLGKGTENPPRPGQLGKKADGILWSGVPGQRVSAYLKDLTFPPESLQLNGSALAAYINEQLAMDYPELTDWTIFLATGNKKEVTIAEQSRRCVLREPRKPRNGRPLPTNRFIIGTALSPLDQAIDLTDAELEEALSRTNMERRSRRVGDTDVPSGEYIRKIRGRRPQNGLLIIYPIDPEEARVEPTERPVISVVVSFPDSDAADKRIYLINSVLQREEL